MVNNKVEKVADGALKPIVFSTPIIPWYSSGKFLIDRDSLSARLWVAFSLPCHIA
jgi:hypothetical protein